MRQGRLQFRAIIVLAGLDLMVLGQDLGPALGSIGSDGRPLSGEPEARVALLVGADPVIGDEGT